MWIFVASLFCLFSTVNNNDRQPSDEPLKYIIFNAKGGRLTKKFGEKFQIGGNYIWPKDNAQGELMFNNRQMVLRSFIEKNIFEKTIQNVKKEHLNLGEFDMTGSDSNGYKQKFAITACDLISDHITKNIEHPWKSKSDIEFNKGLLDLLKSKGCQYKSILFLQVGKGSYSFNNLFEHLLIVNSKFGVIIDENCQSKFGLFFDDGNLQDSLKYFKFQGKNIIPDLYKDFLNEEVLVLVYHAELGYLVQISYEEPDQNVLSSDQKTAWYEMGKRVVINGIFILAGYALPKCIGIIPLGIGIYGEIVIAYKWLKTNLPEDIKRMIKDYFQMMKDYLKVIFNNIQTIIIKAINVVKDVTLTIAKYLYEYYNIYTTWTTNF